MSFDVSLYIHIPFCHKKCPYCAFYSTKPNPSLKSLFWEALELEWFSQKEKLFNTKIVSIYFGGGSPSLIEPEFFDRFLNLIQKTVSIDPSCEITLEANPSDVEIEPFKQFKNLGINRVSLGIQSFSQTLLSHLKRSHTAEQGLLALRRLETVGFSNLSIDLLYDLPYQTLENWKETLELVPILPITHLSLYNLTFEPNTLFTKQKNQFISHIPQDEKSLELLETALSFLEMHHFERYELSAFAKKKFSSIHNLGYWTARPFLGFGPSAFSFWENSRFQNTSDLTAYAQALKEGLSPINFKETLSPKALRKELFVISLRVLSGTDVEQFQKKHGMLDPETQKALFDLQKENFLVFENSLCKLTKKGTLFYDHVAEILI